ncbi:BPL1 [[Candida] subhashii]|uniref:BPL1 n=1 Tax=[Candida] subhashii TaxID=561895 RepID=A0A8J5QRC4_9ASCO|nr:BPL1 [[Candida] subhashii]KAG7663862.1 BPL1 [[Candida] subhashii]
MNVLVYTGPGTTTEGVKHCLEALRIHLSSYYAVLPVNEKIILNEPWMRKTSLLVMPGGADLPYCEIFNGKGTEIINKFVKQGGKYIGFCAGAYFASARCEFEIGNPAMEVSGPRELGFFPGIKRGCAYKGFEYESHRGARAAKLVVNSAIMPHSPPHVINYYNGGGVFVNASQYKNVEVLARYEDKTDVDDVEQAAVVHCKVGKGDVLLTGTHPEFTSHLLKPEDAHFQTIIDTLQEYDHNRRLFLKDCLEKIGLRVEKDVDISIPNVTPLYVTSPFNPDKVSELYSTLDKNLDLKHEHFYHDQNDIFVFQDESHQEYSIDHPEKLEEPQDEYDPTKAVKHVKLLTSGELPNSKTTPYFNINRYFDSLKRLSGDKIGTFGSILGYVEVTTSTNTIMDKNPGWLQYLPEGFAITASTQIAGRGRGGNVWVNPKGVLATSILFKVPNSPNASSTVVTMQYLCGLALIESILGYGSSESGKGIGYEDMPVRLKWPNDIYILKPEYFNSLNDKDDVSSTVDGDEEKYAKVSGALINSQFLNGQFHLVWGAGVNVSNAAPTTSLNLVLEKLNVIRLAKGLPKLPTYEIELLLAKIMFNLNQFYNEFRQSGLKPFLPLYYKRWFHSNQSVTVDRDGKLRKCVIKGITPDYGLLIANDVNTKEVLHLQPDGNSFDIFKGLVYKKT